MKKVAIVLVLVALVSGLALAGGMETIDPSIIGRWSFTAAVTPAVNLGPLPGQQYFMTFREDGTVTLDFEGNVIQGTFAADGTTVAISPDRSQEPSWLPGSPAGQLVELISQARTYTVDNDTLSLAIIGGTSSVDFERVE
jgi:hypothetical protein